MEKKKIDASIIIMKILLLGMMLSFIFIIIDSIFVSKGTYESYNSFKEFISVPRNVAYILILIFSFISGFVLIYFAIVSGKKEQPYYEKYTIIEKEYLKELNSKLKEQEKIIENLKRNE